METGEIRAHLHNYIDKAADLQIEAIYTLLADKIDAAQGRISIEQYNREINESEQEYEAGKAITHSELIEEIKRW